MKTTFFTLISILGFHILMGQTSENYSDQLLTSTFKSFKSADLELADHILPFLKERVKVELTNTSSFTNPSDSLSKYITIKKSDDNLLRLYCWDERNSGCRWTSTTFAQFKTRSNEIKIINLEEITADYDEDLYLLNLHEIEINNQPHYLIIGYGGHCGNHIYQIARVFKISDNTLVKCDSIFNNKNEIDAGASRNGEIEMKYSKETKTLSYNQYEFDEDKGFYLDKSSKVKWTLTKSGFIKKSS
ncbi:hypothetical protein [Maribacter sp. Asnod1-A12]|uniref:hypothetical protein n=1 Tax=Maribacter sp. Asnod1-A12 TaxID=3160576 RepID=UPI003866978D